MIVSAMLPAAERSPCGKAAPQYRYRQVKELRVAQTKGEEHKRPQTPHPSLFSKRLSADEEAQLLLFLALIKR